MSINNSSGNLGTLYEDLGVDRDANDDDIRRAYRKLALKYHPDKNSEADATDTFRRITHAYEVLTTPEKRRHYDQFGTIDHNSSDQRHQSATDPSSFFHDFHQDVLRQMFGNHVNTNVPAHERERETICATVRVSLPELRHGCTRRVTFSARDVCARCKGNVAPCTTCRSSGRVVQQIFPLFVVETLCPACGGAGVSSGACGACGGCGLVNAEKSVDVRVAPGVAHGEQVHIRNVRNVNPKIDPHVDIIVNIEHDLPPGCRVDSATGDVTWPVSLDVRDVFCGFDTSTAPYGEPLKLFARTGYVCPNIPRRWAGMGLRRTDGGQHGDLLVVFNVSFPTHVPHCTRFHEIYCRVFKRPAPSGHLEEANCTEDDIESTDAENDAANTFDCTPVATPTSER